MKDTTQKPTVDSSGVDTSVRAPQRFWWLVLVVVPLLVAAIPLAKGCGGDSGGTANITTSGNGSHVLNNVGCAWVK